MCVGIDKGDFSGAVSQSVSLVVLLRGGSNPCPTIDKIRAAEEGVTQARNLILLSFMSSRRPQHKHGCLNAFTDHQLTEL